MAEVREQAIDLYETNGLIIASLSSPTYIF